MTARDVGLEVTIAGVDVKDSAVDRLSIVWGRGALDEQPDVATLTATIDITRAGWDVNALPAALGSTVAVDAIAGAETVRVFRGTLDEPVISWDDATEHAHLKITADDRLADLAETMVGDEPWDSESAAVRAQRIADLVPQLIDAVVWQSGSTAGDVELAEQLWTIRARDVDRQPALALLHSIGDSTDTGVYVAVGPDIGGDPEADPPIPASPSTLLVLHSLAQDHPGREFAEVGGVFVIVDSAGDELELSADHLRPQPDYRRSRSQALSEIVIVYGPDPDAPLEHTLSTPAGAYRRDRRTTELELEPEAADLGVALMRRAVPTWHTDTLTWDSDDGDPAGDAAAILLSMLDSLTRIGQSVRITDLPSWVPNEAGFVFIEGGELAYEADRVDKGDSNAGRWIVTFTAIPSAGIGRGITYAETLAEHPTMTYNNIDPGISYADARTVGVPI